MQLAQIPTLAPTTTDTGSSFFGGALFVIVLALAFPIAGACFTAWLAQQRGRAPLPWAVLGFFFGPFALLAVGFAPPEGAARDGVVAPGSLASGIRSRLSGRDAPAPTPSLLDDEPLPPPPPPPRAAPRAPAYDEPLPTSLYTPPPRDVEIDVDGAVFHEGTKRMYGRGHAPDGTVTYFLIHSEDKLHDLSDALRVSRPVRTFVLEDDIVPIEALPPELQR